MHPSAKLLMARTIDRQGRGALNRSRYGVQAVQRRQRDQPEVLGQVGILGQQRALAAELGSADLLRVLNRGLIPSHYLSPGYRKSLAAYVRDSAFMPWERFLRALWAGDVIA